ncbi:MAG: EamA family transporter [Rhodospirillaceae bacterium]|nr:EamA family transporter [Rhodospirillaceae bacterium]MBT6138110.1 EamA family transporter [Rhodospirillaceae bacterium]
MLITVGAALAQTLRTAGQKHLTARLSVWSVTWVRFVFGLPFAVLYLVWATERSAHQFPTLQASFLVPAAAAAICQILATIFLVYLFSLRNFAVGTTYARTETVLTAIVGTLLFTEVVGTAGWLAILVSVAGVLIVSMVKSGLTGWALLRSTWNLSAGVGLASGLLFAFSSLFIRKASLSFGIDDKPFAAAITLVTVVGVQTALLGLYILARQAKELPEIMRAWRPCLFVGLTSALGSMGWFTAMSMQHASYVKALGQIEFLFALGVSIVFFREKSTGRELAGMALTAAGIAILLLATD